MTQTNNTNDSEKAIMQSLLIDFQDKCKTKGVESTISVQDYLELEFIEAGDQMIICGILLDNAIEAAVACEEGRRRIDIELYMGNKYLLVLRVVNTYCQDIQKAGGRLPSTKKDKTGHEGGLRKVKELAGKYGGTLELTQEAGCFEALLIVSLS